LLIISYSRDTVIDICLDISFLTDQIYPEITIKIDHEILLSGPQFKDRDKIKLSRELLPGDHRLEIIYHNMHKPSKDHKDMAVLIERVTFQSVEHDFKIWSRYIPDYPDIWLQEQKTLGFFPAKEIHSNYLGWNGTWFLDFQTPIYQWIHRRLDLGWLI